MSPCSIESPSFAVERRILNSSAMITARFDLSGKHIFVGTSSGSILVFNTRTKTVILFFLVSFSNNINVYSPM